MPKNKKKEREAPKGPPLHPHRANQGQSVGGVLLPPSGKLQLKGEIFQLEGDLPPPNVVGHSRKVMAGLMR